MQKSSLWPTIHHNYLLNWTILLLYPSPAFTIQKWHLRASQYIKNWCEGVLTMCPCVTSWEWKTDYFLRLRLFAFDCVTCHLTACFHVSQSSHFCSVLVEMTILFILTETFWTSVIQKYKLTWTEGSLTYNLCNSKLRVTQHVVSSLHFRCHTDGCKTTPLTV